MSTTINSAINKNIDLAMRNRGISSALLSGELANVIAEFYGVAAIRCKDITREYCFRVNKDVFRALACKRNCFDSSRDDFREGYCNGSCYVGLRLLIEHRHEFINKDVFDQITLTTPICHIDQFSNRIVHALEGACIDSVGSLLLYDRNKLKWIPNIGPIGEGILIYFIEENSHLL